MPTYKVPPEPSYGGEAVPATGNRRKQKKRQPTVWIPTSHELMEGLKVGAKGTFTLKGKVVGLDMHEDEEGGKCEVRLAVDTVESYSGKEAEVEDMMDEED